jgi:hypothetical protein
VIGAHVISGKVRPPPANELAAEVTQAIMRGLLVDRSQRFPSMRELLDELRKGLGAHLDTRGSRRARRLFASVFAVLAALGSVPPLLSSKPPPMTALFGVAVGCLVIACSVTLIAFKRLRQHPDHWALVLLVNLAVTQLVMGRGAALWMGLTLYQYTPIDHVIMLGFVIEAAYRFIPRMWWVVGLLAVSGVLCGIAPGLFWRLPAILYPFVGLLYALWWPKRISTPS